MLFAIDRAGIVGPDGPTHIGSFDLSFMRCIPNMVIMAPADENECRQMLTTGFEHDGPAAVRYPRGGGPGIAVSREIELPLPIGKALKVREGQNIALLNFGALLTAVTEAAEELNATVINMRFVKPLDEDLLAELISAHPLFVTIEDNTIAGGAGSAVAEWLNQHGHKLPLLQLGLPDHFIEQGSRDELLAECGLDKSGIIAAVKKFQSALD